MKEYPERFQHGIISLENVPVNLIADKMIEGDLGIKVAGDGRIWLCINGSSFLRFKPIPKEESRP